jgi:hypothetical protein
MMLAVTITISGIQNVIVPSSCFRCTVVTVYDYTQGENQQGVAGETAGMDRAIEPFIEGRVAPGSRPKSLNCSPLGGGVAFTCPYHYPELTKDYEALIGSGSGKSTSPSPFINMMPAGLVRQNCHSALCDKKLIEYGLITCTLFISGGSTCREADEDLLSIVNHKSFEGQRMTNG